MLYRLFFGQNKNRNQYKDYSLFCPFAYRMLEGPILAKDLAVEYKYLANTSEWFYIARKNAERVIRNMTSLTKGKETQCNFSATTPTTRRLYVPFTDSVSLTTSRNRLFFFSCPTVLLFLAGNKLSSRFPAQSRTALGSVPPTPVTFPSLGALSCRG